MSIVSYLTSELPRALRRLSGRSKSAFALLCATRVASADVSAAPAIVRLGWDRTMAALEVLWPMLVGPQADPSAVDRLQGDLLSGVSSPDGSLTPIDTLWHSLLNECLCATIYAARGLMADTQDNAVWSAQCGADARFTADQVSGRVPVVNIVRTVDDVPDESMLVERDLQLQDIGDLQVLDGSDLGAWASGLELLRTRARGACVRL